MTGRLTSQLLVGSLIRTVQSRGGTAMILHKGEAISGSIVVEIMERGESKGFFERISSLSGALELVRCGPQPSVQSAELTQYLDRRTGVDPDIWVVELDIADGQQLAAEILCAA